MGYDKAQLTEALVNGYEVRVGNIPMSRTQEDQEGNSELDTNSWLRIGCICEWEQDDSEAIYLHASYHFDGNRCGYCEQGDWVVPAEDIIAVRDRKGKILYAKAGEMDFKTIIINVTKTRTTKSGKHNR